MQSLWPIFRTTKELDTEIRNYLKVSRLFRLRMRNGGVILIVDVTRQLVGQVEEIRKECSKNGKQVLYAEDQEIAKEMITSLGQDEIKAILLHIGVLEQNFDVLKWLKKEYSEIPVFISGCPEEQKTKIQDIYFNTEIFLEGQVRILEVLRKVFKASEDPILVKA